MQRSQRGTTLAPLGTRQDTRGARAPLTVNRADVVKLSEVLNMGQQRDSSILRRTAAALAVAVVLFASSAAAQTPGIRVGVSGEPDQFYFGGHVETAPLADRLRFRPNIEIGVGDRATLVAFNFEFAYSFPSRRPWSLYVGAGPALNIVNSRRDTQAEGGFNILIGGAHRGGLFGEIKVGALDSPEVKVGIGYVFR